MRIPTTRDLAACALLLAAVPAAAQSLCTSSNGLALTWGGTTRLGDAFSVSLTGTSFASGLIGADLVQGPLQTPIGTVCLGLSPNLTLFPFTLDAFGHFSIGSILPAHPSNYGVQAFLQAAAVDPLQPAGVALSNGLHPVWRPPRLWIMTSVGNSPALCVYDAFADTCSPPFALPGPAYKAALVPELGWLATIVYPAPLNSAPRLMVFDPGGATMVDVMLPNGPVFPQALAIDGTTVSVLSTGTAQGLVQAFSLPSGSLMSSIPLGFPPPSHFLAWPGTGVVFVVSGLDVVPVDTANAVVLPPINLGAPAGASNYFANWLLRDGTLYCMLSGNGFIGNSSPFQLNAIDVATLATIHPATVPLVQQTGVSPMTWGVDALGPGLLAVSPPNLIHIDPGTLQATPVANVGTGGLGASVIGTISAGGSEYVMRHAIISFFTSVNLNTFTPSGAPGPLGNLAFSTPPLAIPSTTLRRLYAVTTINITTPMNQICWFETDPLSAAVGFQSLPLSSQQVIAVID